MKKIIYKLIFIIILFLIVCSYLFNYKRPKVVREVKVSEVTHSVFYTPMYVAKEKGFFKENGIDLNLTTTPGADKVASSVLNGSADIGFSGSETTIYIYNKHEKDYLKSFARLTNKDGSFIITRKKYKNFKIKDLKGKEIIGGRKNGMPELTLRYILKKNKLKAKVNNDVSFDAMASAFISGMGDAVTLFEPTATELIKKGYGYKAAALGAFSGSVPYTSYYAKKSFINNNKELIKRFIKSIDMGLEYTNTHDKKCLAKIIKNEFPNTSIKDLENAIGNYQEIKAWPKNSSFSKEDFNRMQEIMISGNALEKITNYKDLVYDIRN